MIAQRILERLNSFFDTRNGFLDYEGLPVSFQKNKPATQQEISSLFLKDNLKVPTDYLGFLQVTNGCILYNYLGIGGFHFLGTDEIAKENDIYQQTYQEDWDNQITVFCNILGDGDSLGFRLRQENNYEILDCYHDENPYNWKVIGNSFNDFVERLIEEKGRRFWL